MKTLSAAVMSALLVSNAYAAGLGRMTVLSALGQPLRAEIELTAVSKDEIGALAAKLASADAFRQANIDFNAALLSLRFNVENRGDRHFIRITSTQPLNEPFVDMLLELSGPNGRLIREYTFLLDPPELRSTQAAAVAPATVPELGATGTQPMPASEAQTPAPAAINAEPQMAARSPAAEPTDAAGDYQVRQGDTLTQIATRTKPAGISLDQMLVALYQSNPDAFIAKNMNRLKAGQILTLPNAETAGQVDPAAARRLVVTQAADFNAYRQRLAGQIASASAQRSAEARQDAGGRITARVEERAGPAADARDRLQLSHATADAAGSAEDLIARDKALAEAQTRVKELEKNVSDLQKLLELKSQSLADQQKQAELSKTPPAIAGTAAPVAAQPPAAPDVQVAEPPKVAAEPSPPVAAAKPAPKPAAKMAPPPAPPSLIDELLANPLTLPGLGMLLLALGGLGFYRVRRQNKSKQFEDSIIADSKLKANSLFGSTGGQSVDTNNSVFNSSFTPSVSQLDSNEVDPVAEADVYIAYGRDAQAEEILKEALQSQPDRHAVRVKLLEIYSNRKDLRAFEAMAGELYARTKGVGEEWTQAAAMGLAIDPNNPLYASAKQAAAASGASAVPLQPVASRDSGTQPNAVGALEPDTSYFTPASASDDRNATEMESAQAPARDEPGNDLDFDLEAVKLDVEVPNTIPRPAAAEPAPELVSIDFDFLDAKPAPAAPATREEQTASSTSRTMSTLDELETALNEMQADQIAQQSTPEPAADLSFDVDALDFGSSPSETPAPAPSELATTPAAVAPGQQAASAETGAMDFDLSGISLELDPSAANGDEAMDLSSSIDANEMATKLDLAIAYQEIGDKEGARELLDEVVKGGTPEQTEKAKSLLLELA